MSYNKYDNDDEFDGLSFDGSGTMRKFMMQQKLADKGYNVVKRQVKKANGLKKTVNITVYTSSGIGSKIRDAETGEYYNYLVGSANEDLFYTIILATGECNSLNGSKTLFYMTPQSYMSHLKCEVDPETIRLWEVKRDARLKVVTGRQSLHGVVVK